MSSKTKMALKVTAIVIVLLLVLIQLEFVLIPAIAGYTFWILVGAFVLLLIGSK